MKSQCIVIIITNHKYISLHLHGPHEWRNCLSGSLVSSCCAEVCDFDFQMGQHFVWTINDWPKSKCFLYLLKVLLDAEDRSVLERQLSFRIIRKGGALSIPLNKEMWTKILYANYLVAPYFFAKIFIEVLFYLFIEHAIIYFHEQICRLRLLLKYLFYM